METVTKKRLFSKKAFVSTAMFFSFLFLPFSGIMNHQLQFEALSRERHLWMSIHNMAAVLFVIFSLLHIIYNWRAFTAHIRNAATKVIRKETLIAIIVVCGVIGLFASHVLHVG